MNSTIQVYNGIIYHWASENDPIKKPPKRNTDIFYDMSNVARYVHMANVIHYAMYLEFLIDEPYVRVAMEDTEAKSGLRPELGFFSLYCAQLEYSGHTPANTFANANLPTKGSDLPLMPFIARRSYIDDKTGKSMASHGKASGSNVDAVFNFMYRTFKDYSYSELNEIVNMNIDSSEMWFGESVSLDALRAQAKLFYNLKPKK